MSAPPPQQAAGDGMSMVAGTAKIVSEAFNSGFGASLPGWRTERLGSTVMLVHQPVDPNEFYRHRPGMGNILDKR